ncbi:helix-turn-helix domain-containing protein [Lacticaseibacillus hulanensis]|uniref:helix-turn-helix domain-containing protein n=1 Tax=Lacticaseibacillus hulanensis TaxID=2493111 RepID=UPI000FD7FC59|nr:helix-turn-helix domain-containing protein [Lacticaseibacillus hulanensis]
MALKIGRYIMASRQDVGVDPDTLAAQLRIERETLNNWELDVSHPNMDALLALAHVLDIDVRRLVGMKTSRGRSLAHPFAKKDAIQWHHQGSERRQEALSIVLQMAAGLTAADKPVHDELSDYYEQLIQERDTRTDMVINAKNMRLGQKMNEVTITDAMRADYERLIKLAMESLSGR